MPKPKASSAVPARTNPDIDYPKYLAMMEMWDLPEAEKISILHDFWQLVGMAWDTVLAKEEIETSRKHGYPKD